MMQHSQSQSIQQYRSASVASAACHIYEIVSTLELSAQWSV